MQDIEIRIRCSEGEGFELLFGLSGTASWWKQQVPADKQIVAARVVDGLVDGDRLETLVRKSQEQMRSALAQGQPKKLKMLAEQSAWVEQVVALQGASADQ